MFRLKGCVREVKQDGLWDLHITRDLKNIGRKYFLTLGIGQCEQYDS